MSLQWQAGAGAEAGGGMDGQADLGRSAKDEHLFSAFSLPGTVLAAFGMIALTATVPTQKCQVIISRRWWVQDSSPDLSQCSLCSDVDGCISSFQDVFLPNSCPYSPQLPTVLILHKAACVLAWHSSMLQTFHDSFSSQYIFHLFHS